MDRIKILLSEKKATGVLVITTLLFFTGIIGFYNFNNYYIITQTIGFILGLYALYLLLKYPKFIKNGKDAFLAGAFTTLLNIWNSLQEIFITGDNWTPMSTSIHTGLWSVAFSLPYLASFFDKSKKHNFNYFLFITTIINMILLIQADLSILILFNTIIIIGFIVYKPNIKTSNLIVTIIITLILVFLSYKENSFIISNSINNFRNNGLILNSDYKIGESMRYIINNFTFLGSGPKIDINNFNSYIIQDHIFTIYSIQFGFIGFAILFGLLLTFFIEITEVTFKQKHLPNPLILFGFIFIIFQITIGIIQNFDILPYYPNYGIPFLSYSGVNTVVFFIALAYIFFEIEPSKKVINIGKSKYFSDKFIKISIHKFNDEFAGTIGLVFVHSVFSAIFLFILVGMTIMFSHNKKILKLNEEKTEVLIEDSEKINTKEEAFVLGKDSVLYDKNGIAHTKFYNIGDVIFENLAVKSSVTGKWGIWTHSGEKLSEFKFDSIGTKISEVMYKYYDPDFDSYTYDEYNIIAVMKNNKWGFANENGDIYISCKYDAVIPFVTYGNNNVSLSKVTLDGKTFFIDIQDNITPKNMIY